ncbi:SDR family NAD(P)-dependent oxidoreductase [Streptomyces drozdowiczii]|uniref:SDR family NAD(P)-dependent oxidoreductase n=1 Tax=Streptomyces drozdowiczii TaxID=202862 RepID=UPI00403C2C1A
MTRASSGFTLPDLSGSRAAVTAASGGIGLGIATRLAAAGAEVLLSVRNPAKGRAAIRNLLRAFRPLSS